MEGACYRVSCSLDFDSAAFTDNSLTLASRCALDSSHLVSSCFNFSLSASNSPTLGMRIGMGMDVGWDTWRKLNNECCKVRSGLHLGPKKGLMDGRDNRSKLWESLLCG